MFLFSFVQVYDATYLILAVAVNPIEMPEHERWTPTKKKMPNFIDAERDPSAIYPIQNRASGNSAAQKVRARARPLESEKDFKLCTPTRYKNIIIQISYNSI